MERYVFAQCVFMCVCVQQSGQLDQWTLNANSSRMVKATNFKISDEYSQGQSGQDRLKNF